LKEGQYARRVAKGAKVYLAAVLEYLVAEIMEAAGYTARDSKKKRIVPRHIMLAVRGDDELNTLLRDVHFAQAGVVPHIHEQLIPIHEHVESADNVPNTPLPGNDSKKKKKRNDNKKGVEKKEGGATSI
jgi:histone H2A